MTSSERSPRLAVHAPVRSSWQVRRSMLVAVAAGCLAAWSASSAVAEAQDQPVDQPPPEQVEPMDPQDPRMDRDVRRDPSPRVDVGMRDGLHGERFEVFQRGVVTAGENRTGVLRFDTAEDGVHVRSGALVQGRATFIYFESPGGDDDVELGAEMSRAKPYAFGTLRVPGVDSDMGFRLQGAFVPAGGGFALDDAWAILPVTDMLAIRGGQFKEPLARERLTGSGFLLAADRSLVTSALTPAGRVQGASVVFGQPGADLRGEFAIHDGINSANTSYIGSGADVGLSGRVEFKLEGDWEDYEDFTAADSRGLFVVGGGASATWAGNSTFIVLTADAQYETAEGLAFFGALYINPSRVAGESTFSFGLTGQVGFMVNPNMEVFGRAGLLLLDDDIVPQGREDTFVEVTGGVNYYLFEGLRRHRAKMTVDLGILPMGSPGNQPQLNYLDSDDLQIVIRGQFQLHL